MQQSEAFVHKNSEAETHTISLNVFCTSVPVSSSTLCLLCIPKQKNTTPERHKKRTKKRNLCRVDLRVGVIKKAWRHPEADSLYVEEVEVGEGAPRQVVSGLVKYIPEADMQMRRCVLVCNLKPANMRGVKSHAMVLAATSLDGLQVQLDWHRTYENPSLGGKP